MEAFAAEKSHCGTHEERFSLEFEDSVLTPQSRETVPRSWWEKARTARQRQLLRAGFRTCRLQLSFLLLVGRASPVLYLYLQKKPGSLQLSFLPGCIGQTP